MLFVFTPSPTISWSIFSRHHRRRRGRHRFENSIMQRCNSIPFTRSSVSPTITNRWLSMYGNSLRVYIFYTCIHIGKLYNVKHCNAYWWAHASYNACMRNKIDKSFDMHRHTYDGMILYRTTAEHFIQTDRSWRIDNVIWISVLFRVRIRNKYRTFIYFRSCFNCIWWKCT